MESDCLARFKVTEYLRDNELVGIYCFVRVGAANWESRRLGGELTAYQGSDVMTRSASQTEYFCQDVVIELVVVLPKFLVKWPRRDNESVTTTVATASPFLNVMSL